MSARPRTNDPAMQARHASRVLARRIAELEDRVQKLENLITHFQHWGKW